MPSVEFSSDSSREFSPESTSKDSRKLFNPRLFSQTRTDVSVQFSRSRRRPAAWEADTGRSIRRRQAEKKRNFTVFPAFATKELVPHRRAGE
jgi:hypothetical protein